MIEIATVYLCIGTMKTGTTSLQSFMRRNAVELDKQGYCYPQIPVFGKNTHNRNASFLIYRSTNEDENKKKSEEWEVRKKGYEIVAETAQNYENIVLSEELIWHHSKRKNFWAEMKEEFERIGCQVKIVVYLRRQDELVQSLWNQNVKSDQRWYITFAEFINEKQYSYFPLNYYRKLNQIAEAVGKENVIVRVYEAGQFGGSQNNLISDYTSALGIELNDNFKKLDASANQRMRGNFIEIKRIANSVPEYREMSNFLVEYIMKADEAKEELCPSGKTSLFSYEEQNAFMNQYLKSNERVAREYLGREDGVLFRKPLEELPHLKFPSEELYKDFMMLMVQYICKQERRIQYLEEHTHLGMLDSVYNAFPAKVVRKLHKRRKKN